MIHIRRAAVKAVPLIQLSIILLGTSSVMLRRANAQSSADPPTMQQLLAKIDDLQKRVAELEFPAAHTAVANPDPPASAPSAPAPDPPQETSGHTMEVPGGLQMRIQGFTHTGFTASDQKGTTNSFFLGNFDLFITSRLSEKFSMLSELNFEPSRDDNNIGVDLERMLLVYNANDHFQLSVGRFHTAIGYYNTAYHHGNWFETATGRPFLYLFEDQGGILPVHNVGLSATGLLYGGKLGLHYVAELGNGRPARHPENTTVQNLFDENNGKSFNLGLYVRPEKFSGLQAGISIYHDHLTPDSGPRIQELIPVVHVVYINSKFEFLNEAVLIRHAFDNTTETLNMPGFYSQIGRQWGRSVPISVINI